MDDTVRRICKSKRHLETDNIKEMTLMNRNFWIASGIRALRTVCQTAVATIGTAIVITDVNWMYVISASALAGILSILTSIATGLPEVQLQETLYDLDNDPDDEEEDLFVEDYDEIGIPETDGDE